MPGSTTTRWGLYKPGDGDGTANGAPWGSQLRTALDTLDEAVLSGPLAARPAAGVAPRVYFATDAGTNGKLYIDDGTTWNEWSVPTSSIPVAASATPPWYGPSPFSTPKSSDTTWVNQGSASIIDFAGGTILSDANTGANVYRLRVKPYSGNKTVRLGRGVIGYQDTSGGVSSGIVLRDSSSGKFIAFEHLVYSGNTYQIRLGYWTNPTTNSSFPNFTSQASIPVPQWLRVVDDGTNLNFQYSPDNAYWTTYTSKPRLAFLSAIDQAGYALNTYSMPVGGVARSVVLFDFSIS